MAGIGFELKKILKRGTIISMLETYSISAVLSSGPWVISMIVIMLVGFVSFALSTADVASDNFQAITTYVVIMASSLVFSSFFQLPFTRFVADKIFEKKENLVLPNFLGLLLVLLFFGVLFVVPFGLWLLYSQSNLYLLLFMSTFLVLNGVWISNILATSLQFFRLTLVAYLVSYTLIFVLSIVFKDMGKEGLMLSFLLGNSLLFFILTSAIIIYYPSHYLVRFDFFQKKSFYFKLGITGLFYNIAIWIDKVLFWYSPLSGNVVVDNLNASIVYDLPIFLAYLAIIPGMAVFFYRLEADFAENYDNYYDSIRGDGTLKMVKNERYKMIDTVRLSLREILIVQGIFNLIIYIFSKDIFSLLNIPQLYLPLFYVDLIGTQLQLAFMSVLAILFYLDRQREAMYLSILFFLFNAVGSYISIQLGAFFFGYGFAVALLAVLIISLIWLGYVIKRLEYETYMLQ
jgi:uncharacterized membrane protein